ncbi:MAG: hypothetical protein JWO44_891 [Bacteroidetes bacterium]|nr:hypothetical protein [Bacteroidota bacterium]
MNQIDFPHSTIIYKAPVMYLRFKEGAELDVKEIREMIVAAESLSNKKPYLLFSDVRNHVAISSEGRKIAADKKESPCVIANAVLTNNFALKLTANFFIKVNKPHFPVRVFNDEIKAHLWLMQFDPQKDITKILDSFGEK